MGLVNFWLNAYRLPSACITEIEKLCGAFLWSGQALSSKNAKVAWVDLCVPTNEGGLGLRDLRTVNKVTVLKLIWRLFSARHSLWVNWVHEHLVRDGSFWSTSKPQTCSWMWKKILKVRDIAATFLRMEVHSGNMTSFWFDKWSSLGKLVLLTGQRGYIDLGIPANATVRDALTHTRRRHRVDSLNAIETELDYVRQKQSLVDDRPLWRVRDDVYKRKFVTSVTYHQLRHHKPLVEWSSGIWFTHHTPKFAFILWLATRDRLSMGNRMLRWDVRAITACVFCQFPVESRNHLFFDCPYSESVWTDLGAGLFGESFSLDWDIVLNQLTLPNLNKIQSFLRRYLFQAVVYHLWRERNDRRHGKAPTLSTALVHTVDWAMRNRLTSITNLGDVRYEAGMQHWSASRPH